MRALVKATNVQTVVFLDPQIMAKRSPMCMKNQKLKMYLMITGHLHLMEQFLLVILLLREIVQY